MDNNIEKRIQSLRDRLTYLVDIFAGKHKDNADLLEEKLTAFTARVRSGNVEDPYAELATVEDLFNYVERRLEGSITPMDKVRIVRHSQRICLRDILENVYDNFTEVGGQDEHSLDPSMLIARAVITRRRGKKVYTQSVMVIGQEKGHGAEFRNGGSVKPWGNAKAQQYMRVAETEGIPVHTYIFTPGSYPIEDYPGAAQQIARNIYSMGLTHFAPVSTVGINALFFTHLTLVCVLLIYFPFSKLMHMPGVFFSPTRNMANNSRRVRHINPWNPPKQYFTYAEYEDTYRDAMADAGLPLDKQPEKAAE